MLLYLVQHAEAKKEEEDPERGLTDKGFKDISRTAAYAKKLGITATAIHHSGKKRALQTAQVLADHLKPEKGVVQSDGLAPMDDPEIWAKRIAGMNEDLMFVGHMPHMARLALCFSAETRRRGSWTSRWRESPVSSGSTMDGGHWSGW